MISIKKYLKLSVLIAFGAFLTSCEQDTNLSLEIQESVYLRFNTTPDPILTTRATGSVDDSVAESTTIKDLNVFIWNNLFSYHKYYTSVSVATMQIIAGNYHIVAIGNAGKDLGNADVSTLHTTTLAQLDIDTYNNAVMTYMGELSTTAGTNINLPLKRTYAYVAFNFSIASSFPDCTLLSYRLHNVPSTTTLATPASGEYTNAALCTGTTAYYSLNGTTASDQTYIFENCQPDVPFITTEKDRTKDNAPAAATYMELNCSHTDGRLFTLRLYLGNGSPSSFTLKRNTRTLYNITIYSEMDARVTSTEATYYPISQQIIPAGGGNGYYDLGTVSYTATDATELAEACFPTLNVGTLLESKGGQLQAFKNGTWENIRSSDALMIPTGNISGTTATMKYRAYIPTAYLSTASTIQQHMDAKYMVAENQYQTLASVDATTRFGYKATVRCSSPKASFTLSATNPQAGWIDASDPEKNICIETAASNRSVRYVINSTEAVIKNFAGVYDDETGTAVGQVTASTKTSITGIFPVNKTGSYTIRFETAAITTSETNQNQTYMLNRNTITVQDTESHPVLNIALECKEGDGIFLRNATFDSTEKTWSGSEETHRMVYRQTTAAGKVQLPIVFVPLKSGTLPYTITVSDDTGSILVTKTVTNTISTTDCTWNADLMIDPDSYKTYSESKQCGAYYEDINICLRIRTKTPLDYVGAGFEINAPVAFRFLTGLSGSAFGHYPPNPPARPIVGGAEGGILLETTLTLNFKNKEQKIRIYPIKGGWGNTYVGSSSWCRDLTIYEEEQYEDYDWKVYISNGVDFKGQKVEIQLLNEPQINLTINKTLTDGAVI